MRPSVPRCGAPCVNISAGAPWRTKVRRTARTSPELRPMRVVSLPSDHVPASFFVLAFVWLLSLPLPRVLHRVGPSPEPPRPAFPGRHPRRRRRARAALAEAKIRLGLELAPRHQAGRCRGRGARRARRARRASRRSRRRRAAAPRRGPRGPSRRRRRSSSWSCRAGRPRETRPRAARSGPAAPRARRRTRRPPHTSSAVRGSFFRTSSDLRTTRITRRSFPFLVTRFLQAFFSAGESCDDGAAAPGSAPCGTTTSYKR